MKKENLSREDAKVAEIEHDWPVEKVAEFLKDKLPHLKLDWIIDERIHSAAFNSLNISLLRQFGVVSGLIRNCRTVGHAGCGRPAALCGAAPA